jgi:ankyrin repeat protein
MMTLTPNDCLIAQLTEAIRTGNCDMLEQLLDAGADANTILGPRGRPLLTEAIAGNLTDCACLLIARGASVERTPAGVRPLTIAASLGNEKLCRALLDAGADIDDCDLNGKTALYEATIRELPAICRLLVERGADVHSETVLGSLPLNFVSTRSTPESVEIVRILTAGGADPSRLSLRAETNGIASLSAFQIAVMNDRICHIEHYLHECGVDPDHRTGDGRTALELAISPAVEELLRSAAAERAVSINVGSSLDSQQPALRSKGWSPL